MGLVESTRQDLATSRASLSLVNLTSTDVNRSMGHLKRECLPAETENWLIDLLD